MKTLLLMRHAKSSWDDPRLTDPERPLNSRGERDAPRMGQFLVEQSLVPDHVVTSTAVRARATAEFVAAECDRTDHLTTLSDLYHADVSEWSQTITVLPDDWNCVLCVGHNPGIEEFIGTLTSHYIRMPTAAIAHLSSNVSQWDEFALSEHVVMHRVWCPKDFK